MDVMILFNYKANTCNHSKHAFSYIIINSFSVLIVFSVHPRSFDCYVILFSILDYMNTYTLATSVQVEVATPCWHTCMVNDYEFVLLFS